METWMIILGALALFLGWAWWKTRGRTSGTDLSDAHDKAADITKRFGSRGGQAG